MEGWVKIHRQILENEMWLSEPFTDGQAWLDLLLLANHKPGIIKVRGVRIDVGRGHVGLSEVRLSERWKWSRGKVRRFLDFLVHQNMIEIVQQKMRVTTLISIVNYDKYQQDGTTDSTTDETSNGHQTDIKRTSESCNVLNHKANSAPKNVKNVKNVKKESKNPPISPKGDEVAGTPSGKVEVSGVMMTAGQAELFDEFWQTYPKERRTGKGAVVKAWMKIGVDALLSARMVQALEKLKLTEQWNRDGGKYIPMPATWLNQRRWEDDIPEAPGGDGSWKTGIFAGGI